MDQAFPKAAQEARNAMLLAQLSHEIRAPLLGIWVLMQGIAVGQMPIQLFDEVEQSVQCLLNLSEDLRICRACPCLPVMALTGSTEHERLLNCCRAGMTACLSKPLDPDQALGALVAALPTYLIEMNLVLSQVVEGGMPADKTKAEVERLSQEHTDRRTETEVSFRAFDDA